MSQESKNRIILVIVLLIAFDIFVWRAIVLRPETTVPEIYFFDVGQGDSQLINLPGGAQILIDGGPSSQRLAERLADVLPANDRYIDLVILSHPQADHYRGLVGVLKYYRVGAFISNGADNRNESFRLLKDLLREKGIPEINLAAGDRIVYGGNSFSAISPSPEFLRSPELNNGSLVFLVDIGSSTALFTGDIGFEVENFLTANYDVDADILKTPHHGSKYASGQAFLKEASPAVSVIQVGRNSYGHPTAETLARLANVGSRIYRNDEDGTVKLVIDGGRISVFAEKNSR